MYAIQRPHKVKPQTMSTILVEPWNVTGSKRLDRFSRGGEAIEAATIAHKISARVTPSTVNPNMGGSDRGMTHWSVELTCEGRALHTFYSAGYGHSYEIPRDSGQFYAQVPTPGAVLTCLFADEDYSYEFDSAWEMGQILGITDEVEAVSAFNAMRRMRTELPKLLGDTYGYLRYAYELDEGRVDESEVYDGK